MDNFVAIECCFIFPSSRSGFGTRNRWYGTKEAFVAKPQAKHLLSLYPRAHVEIFEGMNHGQLLVDHPEEIVQQSFK